MGRGNFDRFNRGKRNEWAFIRGLSNNSEKHHEGCSELIPGASRKNFITDTGLRGKGVMEKQKKQDKGWAMLGTKERRKVTLV